MALVGGGEQQASPVPEALLWLSEHSWLAAAERVDVHVVSVAGVTAGDVSLIVQEEVWESEEGLGERTE
jgi:hypothetical protein